VFFTVLTQAAVGAFLILLVIRWPSAREGRQGPAGRAGPLVAVFAVLCAGLLAALFHLANPLQAARAFVNVGSSWLSREIVFGTFFAAFLAALVVAEWRVGRTTRWHRVLAGMTAAAGVAFLYCQIQIYLLPSQPAWNSAATPAAFTATALRLGILGVAVGLVASRAATGSSDAAAPGREVETAWRTLRGLALAGILTLVAEILVGPLHLASLAGDASPAAAASAIRLTEDYVAVWVLRLTLLFVAAAALGGALVSSRTPAGYRLGGRLTYAALGLVLLSELCGRFLFYATRVRVGI